MRYLSKFIEKDLLKKMVFIGGPRQVGKTTLAKSLMSHPNFSPATYLNFDNPDHRLVIGRRTWPKNQRLIIFDELHKLKKWKTWIKGIYDVENGHTNFLVTGSARLDVYRRGGDSLQGRYHYWRLHPFTLDECPDTMTTEECFNRLMTVGGFPEPFFSNDPIEAARWRRDRYERLIKEDIRDLASIKDLQTLALFAELLKERVQSTVSLANLANDLEISPITAKNWLSVLESMYYLFVLRPYSHKINRSILKQPKVYFYDNAELLSEGAKLENLVATHLVKRVHFLQDAFGSQIELTFIRDKEKREVDFAIVNGRKVVELYEVKFADETLDDSLVYYTKKLEPRAAYQIVGTNKKSFTRNGIKVISPREFFATPGFFSATSPEQALAAKP
jgi:predicted AAA+ superfamily ATPase